MVQQVAQAETAEPMAAAEAVAVEMAFAAAEEPLREECSREQPIRRPPLPSITYRLWWEPKEPAAAEPAAEAALEAWAAPVPIMAAAEAAVTPPSAGKEPCGGEAAEAVMPQRAAAAPAAEEVSLITAGVEMADMKPEPQAEMVWLSCFLHQWNEGNTV